MEEHDKDLQEQIKQYCNIETARHDIEELISVLKMDRFKKIIKKFVTEKEEQNINFCFWWKYMEMVTILLMFTRAQRQGDWNLHLYSFRCMLPYFMRYDHYNYSRWGSIYLAEMHQLPAEVLSEFQQGNFVVKRSSLKFNQVDPDQSQEWLNAVGKTGGGIVGITRTPSALSRWALSYNLRSHIAVDTKAMYGIGLDEKLAHNESRKSRLRKDNATESDLVAVLERFNALSSTQHGTLQSIATKDLATDEIQVSLLKAAELGQNQLEAFVEERLMAAVNAEGTTPKAFHDPIPRNNAATFATLYEVRKTTKEKEKQVILKADRSVLQRLVTAYEAGRPVDLAKVLQHELMPVPVSLAEMNKQLRSGPKSSLADVLLEGITCPRTIRLEGTSSLLIDGQALVNKIAKPAEAKTFGDVATIFVSTVLKSGMSYDEVHLIFDRYRDESIKQGTRDKRGKGIHPVRRVIEDCHVPLPNNWKNFLALADNKADLARFFSEQLIAQSPRNKTIVVAGGFTDELEVQCSNPNVDVTPLKSSQEEADTRLVLHAIYSNANTVVVSARDTDVLLLLAAHLFRMRCQQLWMMAGTAAKRKYIPVKEMLKKLPPESVDTLLPFHALTGCDTTSYLCGHGKKSAVKIFYKHYDLLRGLGHGELTQGDIKGAEQFVCKMYGVGANVETVDQARSFLFAKCGTPEALPPTSDALGFHIKRAHYQAMVWQLAHCAIPVLPAPDTMGWEHDGGKLIPILMSLSPIPEGCMEMIFCQCKTGCRTCQCGCRTKKLFCTAACKCRLNEEIACVNKNNN
jgi:hypothetical protein